MEEEVVGLPKNTSSIFLKFGLTDLNVRRDYVSLVVYQPGSESKMDLTNNFFAGPQYLPPFGLMTELLMPWDDNLEQKVVVEFQVNPPTPNAYPDLGYFN